MRSSDFFVYDGISVLYKMTDVLGVEELKKFHWAEKIE